MKLLALACVLCVCSLGGIAASSEANVASSAAVKAAVAPGSVPAAQQQMAAAGAQQAAAAAKAAKPAAAAGDAAAGKVSAAAYRDKASPTTMPAAQPQQQAQAFAAQVPQQQQQQQQAQQLFTAAPGVQYVTKPAAYQQPPPVTAYVPQYQTPYAPYAFATPPGAAGALPYKPAVQYVAQQPYAAAPYPGPQYVAPPQYPEGAYAYPQPQPQPQPQYQYYPAPAPPKSYSSYEEKKPEYDSYKSPDKYEKSYEKSYDKYEKSSDKYDKYESKGSDKYYDSSDKYDSYDSGKDDYYAPPAPTGICQSATFGAFYTQAVDLDIQDPSDLDGVVSAFVGCNERTTLGGECSYVCYDGEHYERFVGVATRIVASPPQDWGSVDPWYHPVYCAWALGGNVSDFRASAPKSKMAPQPGAKQDLPPLFSCDFTIRVECCDDIVPLVPSGPEIDLGADNGGGGGVGASSPSGGGARKLRRRLTRNGQPVASIAAVRESPAFTPIKHSKVTGGFMGLQKHGTGATKATTSGLTAGNAAAAAAVIPGQQQPSAAAAKLRARAGHTLGQSVMAVQQRV